MAATRCSRFWPLDYLLGPSLVLGRRRPLADEVLGLKEKEEGREGIATPSAKRVQTLPTPVPASLTLEPASPIPEPSNTPGPTSTQPPKWKLRSGRFVEDIIQQEERNLASQYIIDLACGKIRNLFTNLEWEEVKESAKPR